MTRPADLELRIIALKGLTHQVMLYEGSADSGSHYLVELLYDELGDEQAPSRLGEALTLDETFFSGLRERLLDPREAGQWLQEHLFVPSIRSALLVALGASLGIGRTLRLRFNIDNRLHELHQIPWEMLILPSFTHLLGDRTTIFFSRYLLPDNLRRHNLRPQSPLRTLVATASPPGAPGPINAASEIGRVRKALGSEAIVDGLPDDKADTLARLTAGLGRQADGTVADVLCFVAHGAIVTTHEELDGEYIDARRPMLYLEKADGSLLRAPAAQLVDRIARAAELPRLIILGSCESAGDGYGDVMVTLGPQLVACGVPAVVAMQGKISVETFERFLHTFLRELAHSGEADQAMATARAAIQPTQDDWWVPVLFLRTRHGRIWAQGDIELSKTVLTWLQHKGIGARSDVRHRVAQALLACPVTSELDWSRLDGLDSLLDELEQGNADTAFLDQINRLLAELLPQEIALADARALRRLLAPVRLFSEELQFLFSRVRPQGHSWPPPMFDDQPGRLSSIVTKLGTAARDPLNGRPPLLNLVDLLLALHGERAEVRPDEQIRKIAPELQLWRERVAPHLPPLKNFPSKSRRMPFLQVQIRAGRRLTATQRFSCGGWLYYGDDDPQRAQGRALGDIYGQFLREQLPAVFRKVVQEGLRELPPEAHDVRIEVFLPVSLLLVLDVDQWQVDFGDSSAAPVGQLYQVVARSLERVQSERVASLRLQWQRKWSHVSDKAAHLACSSFHWVDGPESGQPPILLSQLLDDSVVALGQTWHPAVEPDAPALLTLVDHVIGAGVPIALMVRPCNEPPDRARTMIEEWLKESTLAELPDLVRKRRRLPAGDVLNRRLILLWDDPSRMPPSITYTNGE